MWAYGIGLARSFGQPLTYSQLLSQEEKCACQIAGQGGVAEKNIHINKFVHSNTSEVLDYFSFP